MFIKYKGNTGALLSDLSTELNLKVDLKTSEYVLKNFFQIILKDVPQEKAITIISSLPSFLKPFCNWQNIEDSSSHFFSESKKEFTIVAIFKILDKYVPAENLAKIFSCLPEKLFYYCFSKRKLSNSLINARI